VASETRLRVGTRGSQLAVWQADRVIERLAALGAQAERVLVRTTGDRILDAPLSKIGDKGLFTKELEERLVDGTIDVAVHSLKDLPTNVPEGLVLGAVLEREDPSDALVCPGGQRLAELPRGARVGTSSLRRRAQLLALRPDLDVRDLRGNVPTRLSKVERGEYDAAVMARAGLVRLGLGSRITETIDLALVLPAVGQGAIAVEARAEDPRTATWLGALDHRPTHLATVAERALLGRLEGGCQVPIGALATWEGPELRLRGLVADLDGQRIVRGSRVGCVATTEDAREVGERLAELLLVEGGDLILERVRAGCGRDTISPPGSAEPGSKGGVPR
jgi:hydroxymethylbilane synthase